MAGTNTAEQLLPAQRAALYIRVSTDEQARKGYSLPTQQEALEIYAKQHGYDVMGLYIDDGVSAHQKYTKRPGLMRMLSDVEAGKLDTILFIKLDRWFRSIKEYYKVQEILDKHHVTWKTTMEQYGTGAQDILVTNLMLTIAQAESDRTSERIKFVFEGKVTRGEVVTGKTPFGYKIENKRMVIDPDKAELARDMFRTYAQSGSLYETMRYMRSHGVAIHQQGTRKALANPLYKGEYRGNPNYCEPLIPAEEFDAVQVMLKKRSVRWNQTGRVYLFTGLMVCGVCGSAMNARCQSTTQNGKTWTYCRYLCNRAVQYHECVHRKGITEKPFEEWLLTSITAQLEAGEERYLMAAKKTPKSDAKARRAAITRKLDKLKDLYMDDLISKDRYRADYERYQSELSAIPDELEEAAPDFNALRKILEGDFRTRYEKMDRPGRKDFWRSLIEKITFDADNEPTIFFRRTCY